MMQGYRAGLSERAVRSHHQPGGPAGAGARVTAAHLRAAPEELRTGAGELTNTLLGARGVSARRP